MKDEEKSNEEVKLMVYGIDSIVKDGGLYLRLCENVKLNKCPL